MYFRQQQTIYGCIIVRPVDLYCQFDFLHITHIIWTLYYNWIHEKQCCGNIARKSKKETMLTKVSYLTDTAQLFLKEELWHQNLTVKCLLQRPFSLLIQLLKFLQPVKDWERKHFQRLFLIIFLMDGWWVAVQTHFLSRSHLIKMLVWHRNISIERFVFCRITFFSEMKRSEQCHARLML